MTNHLQTAVEALEFADSAHSLIVAKHYIQTALAALRQVAPQTTVPSVSVRNRIYDLVRDCTSGHLSVTEATDQIVSLVEATPQTTVPILAWQEISDIISDTTYAESGYPLDDPYVMGQVDAAKKIHALLTSRLKGDTNETT